MFGCRKRSKKSGKGESSGISRPPRIIGLMVLTELMLTTEALTLSATYSKAADKSSAAFMAAGGGGAVVFSCPSAG